MSAARVPRSPSIAAEAARPPVTSNIGARTSFATKASESVQHEEEGASPFFGLLRLEWELLTLSTAVKLLLWPTYHSTDFEVHRNWLAITRSLPMRDWYFEATSQWTLDYPPFFAYFSWILAQPASLVDPLIVSLHEGLEYAAWSCKAYMRATVILTELVLAAALLAHTRLGTQRRMKVVYADDVSTVGASTSQLLAASLLMHPGLIIIDHIHFQYNGFLFGVLAWSLWAAREDKPLLCAFLFSSLLNLKHIYVYVAPSFLIFLLRSYVFPVGSGASELGRSLERLITVGVVTLLPFVLSLTPLAMDGLRHEAGPVGVLKQMVQRLFPFSRGLIHAYWAPNAWALWTFTDRVLVKLVARTPAIRMLLPASWLARYDAASSSGFASASRGLVENISFGVLPNISPSTCFMLTLTCMSVYMVKLWQTPTYRSFLASVSLCGMASFLFGWHVHEKAIMLPLIPYTLLAADDYAHFRTFTLLSAAGIVSLFPLLFTPEEGPIKVVYSIVWAMLVFGSLQRRVFRPMQSNVGILTHRLETVYLWGFLALQAYVSVVHPLVFANHRQAVPVHATAAVDVSSSASHLSTASSKATAPAIIYLDASSIAAPAATPEASAAGTAAVTHTRNKHLILASIPPTTESTAESQGGTTELSKPTLTVSTAEFDAPRSVAVAVAAASASADLLSISAAHDAHDTQGNATVPTRGRGRGMKTEPMVERDSRSMEFLPLMMVSVYCSLGIIWAWIRASALYLSSEAT